MIRDTRLWQDWEKTYLKSDVPDFFRNLHIVDALYEEARSLGAWPGADPLDGLDVKIYLAKAVNV